MEIPKAFHVVPDSQAKLMARRVLALQGLNPIAPGLYHKRDEDSYRHHRCICGAPIKGDEMRGTNGTVGYWQHVLRQEVSASIVFIQGK